MNAKRVSDVWTTPLLLSHRVIWGLTLILLCLLAGQGLAMTPGKINYQGLLQDTDTGDPLEGTHTLIFKIFDQAEEGMELWSETQVVEVGPTGVFSVILGSTDPIDLSFSAPYWLEVEVAGEVLLPRRELVSVPYAFRSRDSDQADNADSLGGVPSGNYVVEGEVGVVTTDMISDGSGSGLDADLLDGLDSDAFADSGHTHDDRYYTQDSLNTAGTINDTANPVDWTRLKSVPAGFADGTDDVGPGDGHSLDADDGSPVDALYVDSEGRVGIGTMTPAQGRVQVEATGKAIYARSNTGTGVFAVAGEAVGGESDAAIVATSTTKRAISAVSLIFSALYGETSAPVGAAIVGRNTGGGQAIVGYSAGPYTAVSGVNDGDGTAVGGYANSGIGVWGTTIATDGIPVAGTQLGYSTDDLPGGYKPGGYFGGRSGVIGVTKEHAGSAVRGDAQNPGAFSGVFTSDGHGVSISTPAGKTGLSVFGGTKTALVATADGARSLYCEEASEVWFSDYGFGKLESGVAMVEVDPVFAQTVNLGEPYHVFLQAYGDADLYVASRGGEGFEVRVREGDPYVEFSYRLMAKRLGYENERLARAPWADNDTHLSPEKAARQQGED
jgi:hypothetical protein